MADVIAVLHSANSRLVEGHWKKGVGHDPVYEGYLTINHSLLSALSVALRCCESDPRKQRDLRNEAKGLLRRALREMNRPTLLRYFNDHPDTTLEDVKNVIERAIEIRKEQIEGNRLLPLGL